MIGNIQSLAENGEIFFIHEMYEGDRSHPDFIIHMEMAIDVCGKRDSFAALAELHKKEMSPGLKGKILETLLRYAGNCRDYSQQRALMDTFVDKEEGRELLLGIMDTLTEDCRVDVIYEFYERTSWKDDVKEKLITAIGNVGQTGNTMYMGYLFSAELEEDVKGAFDDALLTLVKRWKDEGKTDSIRTLVRNLSQSTGFGRVRSMISRVLDGRRDSGFDLRHPFREPCSGQMGKRKTAV